MTAPKPSPPHLAVNAIEYPPGRMPTVWTPGDMGVVSYAKMDFVDELIRARERVACGHTVYAELDHAWCVVSSDGSIVEANEPGVQRLNASEYVSERFWVLTPTTVSDQQRQLCVEFWLAQVGDSYDLLDFILTQFPLGLFGVDYSLHGDRAWICSGLAATGWLKYLPEWTLPAEAMTPGEICRDLGVPLGGTPEPLDFWGRALDKLAMVTRTFAHVVRRVLHV